MNETKERIRFNILVCGDRGSGKSTFINCLLRSFVDGPINLDEFRFNEKSPIKTRELYTDAGDCVDFSCYEIDSDSRLTVIADALAQWHEDWRNIDAQAISEAEFRRADNRIHCIIYMMNPHTIKECDREFVCRLAPLAPIIPIITKADTMTIEERNIFLLLVCSEMCSLSSRLGYSCIHDFGDQPIDASDFFGPSRSEFLAIGDQLSMGLTSSDILHPAEHVESRSNGLYFVHSLFPSFLQQSNLFVGESSSTQLSSHDDQSMASAVPVPLEDILAMAKVVLANPSGKEMSPSLNVSPEETSSDEEKGKKQSHVELLRIPNIFATVCDLKAERVYPWGSIKVDDPLYSDIRRLRVLLFESDRHIRKLTDCTRLKSIALFPNPTIRVARVRTEVDADAADEEGVVIKVKGGSCDLGSWKKDHSGQSQKAQTILRAEASGHGHRWASVWWAIVVAAFALTAMFTRNRIKHITYDGDRSRRCRGVEESDKKIFDSIFNLKFDAEEAVVVAPTSSSTLPSSSQDRDPRVTDSHAKDKKQPTTVRQKLYAKARKKLQSNGNKTDCFDGLEELQSLLLVKATPGSKGDEKDSHGKSGGATVSQSNVSTTRFTVAPFDSSMTWTLIFVKPAEAFFGFTTITPLWYKYENLRWFWSPYDTDDSVTWFPVSNKSATVGLYKGEEPAAPNKEILKFLESQNPKLFMFVVDVYPGLPDTHRLAPNVKCTNDRIMSNLLLPGAN